MLELRFKRLTDTMTVPTKAHDTDACFDLYADINIPILREGEEVDENTYFSHTIEIPPRSMKKVHTGFSTNIPHGWWGAIFPRSGIATNQHLRLANCTGVIDGNYTGEWLVCLQNDSDEIQRINHGDRIAQFVLLPAPETKLVEVNELDATDRMSDGFGSSGR